MFCLKYRLIRATGSRPFVADRTTPLISYDTPSNLFSHFHDMVPGFLKEGRSSLIFPNSLTT
ncbi:MAG: hypothetical protein A4E57_01868 [Syntrophorhabdaceae bacterium PtaU1.Bin034]|nr:MAG: hypothetical protein A4E57_01868 [Syntrophorhabdaceae bacterium PtaU1.Bin034]